MTNAFSLYFSTYKTAAIRTYDLLWVTVVWFFEFYEFCILHFVNMNYLLILILAIISIRFDFAMLLTVSYILKRLSHKNILVWINRLNWKWPMQARIHFAIVTNAKMTIFWWNIATCSKMLVEYPACALGQS